jgi:hypothetical protein
MTDLTISVSEPHHRALRACLFPRNGHEAGALVLWGRSNIASCPWSARSERRYLSREVIPIPPADVESSSQRHFAWRKAQFLKAYRAAREETLAIAFVHSHREIHAFFSNVDDDNDRALAELVAHRQSPRPDLLSIVVDEERRIVARQLVSPAEFVDVGRILDYGPDLWRVSSLNCEGPVDRAFDRQELAFGSDFLLALKQLRIVIIGAGATGSAVLALLMRLGAHYIAVIDPQDVDKTNTTRIHGSCRRDAEERMAKVTVAQRMVEQSGFAVDIKCYKNYVTDSDVRDVLKSADLVMGCTDDHEGRLFINRFSYFYNAPAIDMGILIDPERIRDHYIRMADGRVTVVGPGLPCLVCRAVADPAIASAEHLKRTNPREHGVRAAQGYIVNTDAPAPSVISLTTNIACQAVDELTARLTGYRAGTNHILRKFVSQKDHFPAAKTRSCRLCDGRFSGRGDITPFLDRVD